MKKMYLKEDRWNHKYIPDYQTALWVKEVFTIKNKNFNQLNTNLTIPFLPAFRAINSSYLTGRRPTANICLMTLTILTKSWSFASPSLPILWAKASYNKLSLCFFSMISSCRDSILLVFSSGSCLGLEWTKGEMARGWILEVEMSGFSLLLGEGELVSLIFYNRIISFYLRSMAL